MMNNKPNILLIVIDCLRADRVHGPGRSAQVPNLEKVINNGALFTDLITVNSMTTPCMTSLFSGLYPHTHGVRAINYARVSDDIPLLAEILRDNGYETFAEATGPVGPFTHLNRGFDHYNKREGVSESFLRGWGEEFISRFRDRKLTEPWFVYLHLWEVHMPRQVNPKFDSQEFGRSTYDRAISSVDARLGELFDQLGEDDLILITGDHGEKTADTGLEAGVERMKAPLVHMYRTKLRQKLGKRGRMMYKRTIDSLKEAWIATARTLHRQGIIENPLKSLTGHGFHVYDSLVRVPLIVGGLNTTDKGIVIGDQIRQIDVLPTILDLVGLSNKVPENLDGRSFMPLLNGEEIESLPAIIETCQTPSQPSDLYGVRADDWKYATHLSDETRKDELYDLKADPEETQNLAEARPDVIVSMRALLDTHLRKEQRGGVALADDLSGEELDELAKHLEKLGYIE